MRSAKLAGLALVITIPLAIAAGIFAARRRDRPSDRAIVLLGVTSSSIPEFVTGTILVIVVGVQLELLPVLATPPRGRRLPHRDPISAHAGDGDGDRVLRVHRPDDPRRARSTSSSRTTLRTADNEGPDDDPGHAPPRPPERPDPDGRRHRGPDRLPVRRHHRRREDLQLQRDGPDDAVRSPAQGHPDADRRGDHRRHRLHACDTRRRPDRSPG